MKDFRFFVDRNDICDGEIFISGEDLHKIKNVLRYKIGDDLTLLLSPAKKNPGKEYLAKITAIDALKITSEIIRETEIEAASLNITLYLSLIKSNNFETAIKKATELGVNKIVPLNAKRSVVKVKKENAQKKKMRWKMVVKEAACQCKRADIPIVTDIVDIDGLKKIDDDSDVKIVCDAKSSVSLKDLIKSMNHPLSVSAAVGPEGGFTREETQLFNSLGFRSVLLSDNILRAETVPLFLMSVLQYELGRSCETICLLE